MFRRDTVYLIVLLYFIFLISCKNSASVNNKCRDYNDRSVKLLSDFLLCSDTTLLDESYSLINKAIDCNPNYFTALHNKVVILDHYGNYQEAIFTLDKALKLNGYKDPSLFLLKGTMYDKQLKTDSANIFYSKSLFLSDELIKQYPDSINLLMSNLIALTYLEGTDQALKKLNDYSKSNSDELFFNKMKSFIKEVDRNDFYNTTDNSNGIEFVLPKD